MLAYKQPGLLGLGIVLCLLPIFLSSASSQTGETSALSPSPQAEAPLVIEKRFVTRGFQRARDRVIDTVVLHSAYNPRSGDRYSVSALLEIFRREGVAAHYLIDREGQIYQLVRENDIAYHAGRSRWQGRVSISRFSIGIELLNHPSDRYTEAQYHSLNRLLQNIEARYSIRSVVGHGAIAPDRRSDPWNFDWLRLSRRQTPETLLGAGPAFK